MKKLMCLILTAVLVLTPATAAFAKQGDGGKDNHKQTISHQNTTHQNTTHQNTTHQTTTQQSATQQATTHQTTTHLTKAHKNNKIKEQKQSFKMAGSPVIKYGKYKLPIKPIEKGMGATVTFDKNTAIITVVKTTNTIVIDLKNKTVTVNGAADTTSGIFTAKNDKKMNVLIKYIAKVLGVRVEVDKDKVHVTVPGLDFPTNVTVTPIDDTTVPNTLNSTTLYMTAAANIVAGQATGGKAELYVGTKLVATDAEIAATDTSVTFTTSDGTPTNEELQVAVPTGGAITVKLYNTTNGSVISTKANPTLTVDYTTPTITGVLSATQSVSGTAFTVTVVGAGAVGDKVDVSKISLTDTTLGKTYTLTSTAVTGSVGVVSSENTLTINLGTADILGLAGFGTSTEYLTINTGSLLSDTAGNASAGFTSSVTVPVIIMN